MTGVRHAVLDVSIGVPAGIGRKELTPATGQRDGSAATQYESGVMTYRSGNGMAGGWYLGFKPRAKISMIVIRPPQQGHGRA